MRESMATAFCVQEKGSMSKKGNPWYTGCFVFYMVMVKKSDPKEKTRKVKTQSIEGKRLIARKIRSQVLRPRRSGTPHLR
jgi:hypothetical protein